MAMSMPVMLIMTMIIVGVVIILVGQTRVQMDPVFPVSGDSEQNDLTGTPVEGVEEIFAASGSTGPAPTDEVFTASGSTGPAPMDADSLISSTQLKDILDNATDMDVKIEIAKQVVDVIEKIEIHNVATVIDENATSTLDDILRKKSTALKTLRDAMIAESDIEALNEVALEDAEEIDMKIADLERDRLATIEIKKEEYRLRMVEIQRALDDIAEQERLEKERELVDLDKSKSDHLAKMVQYQSDQEGRRSNLGDMLQEMENYKSDEDRIKADLLSVQTRVNLAKDIENGRLASELLKLGDSDEDTPEIERLKAESVVYMKTLSDEIESATSKLDKSIEDRKTLLADIGTTNADILRDIKAAEALDDLYEELRDEKLTEIEFNALSVKEKSDMLVLLNGSIQDEFDAVVKGLDETVAGDTTRLQDERKLLYVAISDRRTTNDEILQKAKDDLDILIEQEREATEDKMESTKAVTGTAAAIRRGQDLNMYMSSIARFNIQRDSIIDSVESGAISEAARDSCAEDIDQYTKCISDTDDRNEVLLKRATKRITDHEFKMGIGYDITPEEYKEYEYKRVIGFNITPQEHLNLATNPDIEKVIKPIEDRTIREIDEQGQFSDRPVAWEKENSYADASIAGRLASGGMWVYVEDSGVVGDPERRIDITKTLIDAHRTGGDSYIVDQYERAAESAHAVIELDLAAMGYTRYGDINDDLNAAGYEIYEGDENRYANGVEDAYFEMSLTGPEKHILACGIAITSMENCINGLNVDGTVMTEEALNAQIETGAGMNGFRYTCESNPDIDPIEPMDCYVTWDKSGCKNPKVAGVVVPRPIEGYDYGSKTATVEFEAMYGGKCEYQTGQMVNCVYGDKYSEARAKLDAAEMMAESLLS